MVATVAVSPRERFHEELVRKAWKLLPLLCSLGLDGVFLNMPEYIMG